MVGNVYKTRHTRYGVACGVDRWRSSDLTETSSHTTRGGSSPVDQVNLRIPLEMREYLEKLASAAGSKLHPYLLSLLEAHVDQERDRLAAIYRDDAERAAKTAKRLDNKAASAERKADKKMADSLRTIEDSSA